MEKIREIFALDGKTALVTGGSRGLGFSMAKGLACFGADAAIIARDGKQLDEAKSRLEKTGRRIICRSFDLKNTAATPQVFNELDGEAGGIDILVNNAGINIRASLAESSEEDWDAVMDVNLKSAYILSRSFVRKRLERKKPGRIINITSLAAEGARAGIGIYAASKGALRQLTKAFAVECAQSGINVNAIGPGYYKTPMNEPLAEDARFDRWVKENAPAGRWGEPDELIGAAVFLASDASSYVNGQTIYVDGGWLAKL